MLPTASTQVPRPRLRQQPRLRPLQRQRRQQQHKLGEQHQMTLQHKTVTPQTRAKKGASKAGRDLASARDLIPAHCVDASL
jgi:hypothetical protein